MILLDSVNSVQIILLVIHANQIIIFIFLNVTHLVLPILLLKINLLGTVILVQTIVLNAHKMDAHNVRMDICWIIGPAILNVKL